MFKIGNEGMGSIDRREVEEEKLVFSIGFFESVEH